MIEPAALQTVVMTLTGWLDCRERHAIAYLIEENRLLRRQLGVRRLRLTVRELRAALVYIIERARQIRLPSPEGTAKGATQSATPGRGGASFMTLRARFSEYS